MIKRLPEQPIAIIDEEINGITGKSMISNIDKELENYDGKIKMVKVLNKGSFAPLRIKKTETNKNDICFCCSTKAMNCVCYSLYKYYRGKSCVIHEANRIKEMYNIKEL